MPRSSTSASRSSARSWTCGFRRKPATHSDAKPANVPIWCRPLG